MMESKCMLDCRFLANLCNSTVIEIYDDIIRVSHGFDGCQMLEYIAGTCNLALTAGIDDITSAESVNFRRMCWYINFLTKAKQGLFGKTCC